MKPPKPKRPKPVIVKTYSGFFATSQFEREARRLAAQGYYVQAVTSKGPQITRIDTKGSLIGRATGLPWGSTSKVKAKDGGLVVTYAITDQHRTEVAAQAERYPHEVAAYNAALAQWKASKPRKAD